MRKLLALTALTAAVAAPTAFAATKTIKIGDNWFIKPGNGTVTVSKGTVAKWTNTGRSPHNVKVTSGPRKFKSDTLFPGDSYRKRMRVRGTYKIICTIHSGQRMTLRVK